MTRAAGGAEPVEMRAQPASELVWRLANAGFAARRLQVVAELGVADRIDEAPVPVAALASSCAVDTDALDRGRQYLEHSTTRAVKKEKHRARLPGWFGGRGRG